VAHVDQSHAGMQSHFVSTAWDTGGSYGSQNDLRLHFGLGTGSVDRVEVRWPDRKTETVAGVRPRHLNRIVEGRGVVEEGARVP
jgi:hypothetical protein